MFWVVDNIQRLMIVSGLLTLTMVYGAIAPEAALQSTFGETIEGPVADVVVRNWAALIGLIGALLIYGARNIAVRHVALVLAGISKTIFIALVLSHGQRFLAAQAGVAIAVDALWVVVFAWYFVALRRRQPAAIAPSAMR